MEPEISRRCRSCGAAVRSRAGFCPQCGATVAGSEDANPAPAVEMADASSSREEVVPEASSPEVSSPEMPSAAVETSDASHEEVVPQLTVSTNETGAQAEAVTSAAVPAAAGVAAAADAEPTRRHRVKVAARDAMEGKIAPRVEKMRRASTVVLDEAADDPGLRFVLIAALLILLSLGLVLLSQILK